MRSRDIVSLACKVLGTYVLILGVIGLSEFVYYSQVKTWDSSVQPRSLLLGSLMLSIIWRFLTGALLWRWSDGISSVMTAEDTEGSQNAVTARDLAVIGLVVAGVWILRYSLQNLSWAVAYLRVQQLMANVPSEPSSGLFGLIDNNWKQTIQHSTIFAAVSGGLSLLFGLVMLIRPRNVLRLVYRPKSVEPVD